MCHTSGSENEQIEKCIENGMPRKIIKTVKFTMRKRAGNEHVNNPQQQNVCNENSNSKNNNHTPTINTPEPQLFISKCPFGHGKFTTPAAQFLFSPLMPQPLTTTTTSLINKEIDNSNNNSYNSLLPQQTETNATSSAEKNANTVTNLSGHFDDDSKKLLLATEKIVYNGDILAKSTQISREFAYKMQQAIRRLQQSSKIYTLLTKTSQPAHLVAMGIITFILLAVWPELIDTTNSNNSSSGQQSTNGEQQLTSTVPMQEMSAKKTDMFVLIAYLGSFSIHFGAQIWMTFVSGLSLYFSLPRHIFGQCQQILFPKYFATNAALSIIMLIIYVKFFINTWTLAKCVQFGALALSGSIELLVRLYLAAPLLHLMQEKYKIEGTVGSGEEVGSLVQGDLIKCPHYQRIHKAFRRLHMTVALGNIITMAGSCLQLYNIAGQLQISIVH